MQHDNANTFTGALLIALRAEYHTLAVRANDDWREARDTFERRMRLMIAQAYLVERMGR